MLISCEDLFLRFKYDTINCKKNAIGLDKISISNDSLGSLVDVQFGDIYYSIKIIKNNKNFMLLSDKDLNLEISIFKDEKNKVEVRIKNKITILSCETKTFKM